ncbi:MAG: right-handed parallel beta-helix repeat-containing protein [Thermoguttaceae bacterium]
MKTSKFFLIVLLFSFVITFFSNCFAAETLQIFVSPNGNDSANGSEQTPFATIQRARNEVRKKKEASPNISVTVTLRGGEYLLPEGIVFTDQDSGTSEHPIIYQAFQGETPILIGGKRITNFQSHRDNILKSNMSEAGVGDVFFRQLFFDGKRMHLARYPNFDPENPYGGGWAYAAGKTVPMYLNIEGETQNEFDLKESDYRKWKKPDELEVMVFARYNWWNNILPVKSIDPETRHVTLAGNASYPIRPGDRFYVRNSIEELDAPGEWFLDKETKTLYFYPPSSMDGKSIFVPTNRFILRVEKGAKYIHFDRLTFECSEGTAVEFLNTDFCRMDGCTVRNVGDYRGSGINISGGKNNTIYGCNISETGASGISMHSGDVITLTPGNNVAENNYIHHVGIFYKQGVGISVGGVGQRVAHNLIHDGPRMAIMFGGNNHIFEYNHIRHMNLETSDTGAFYTGGRDWLGSRGTVIRYNFMHDILGYGKDATEKWVSPYYAWGVYLDDNAGGVDVIGNIALRCPRAGIHLHNGRDNRIENNIFADCTLQQMEGNGWIDTHRMWIDHFPTMVKGYESVADQPAWKTMRNMKLHPKDAVLPNKMIMSGNAFLKNIIFYRDKNAQYVKFNRFPYDANEVDYNVIWSGDTPIRTGVRVPGNIIGENVAPNGSFESGEIGKLPVEWSWQCRPSNKTTGGLDATEKVNGKMSLRIDADYVAEKPRDNNPIVASRPISLKLGNSYRLAGRFKATEKETPIQFYVHYWSKERGYWGGAQITTKLGTEWTTLEQTLTIPVQGMPGFIEGMDGFRISLSLLGKSGSVYVDDVVLEETETLDEWDSWRKQGMDLHSVIADPKFVGEANMKPGTLYSDVKDFMLQNDSPALKLGFQQIPVDKIGPYSDPRRATWPIVEAEGAREKPLVAEKAAE